MKILHVSAFDAGGGAARAMMRLHEGLLEYGIGSHVVTVKPTSESATVSTPLRNWQIAAAVLQRHAAMKIVSLQKTPTNTVIHSLGQFPSGLGRWIDASDFDVVNLHWICAEALSIGEIARIRKPVVWTMHDMWPFSGAEHYDDLENPGRWKAPYTAESRPRSYRGPDIDRYVWARKAKLWFGKTFQLVAPSRWLARCAAESTLMGGQPCEVIHNPLDTARFAPVNKLEARRMLGLPLDRKLVLFGALGATSDLRKGYDLLLAALSYLKRDYHLDRDVDLAVFGGATIGAIPGLDLRSHFLGTFQDELSLRVAYSAADVFVAPSRQDNLPNTVVEAGACGVPTAAFDIGGMPDLVTEGKTGALAPPFDAASLAGAIHRLLSRPIPRETVRAAMKAKVSPAATLPAYLSIYERLLQRA